MATRSFGLILHIFVAQSLASAGVIGSESPDVQGISVDLTDQKSLPADVNLRRDPVQGTIQSLKGRNLSVELEQDDFFRALQSANRFAEIALAFLNTYRSEFKLQHPADELLVESVVVDDLGFKQVRLQQVFEGIPIWGEQIIVQMDRSNHVNLVHGRYVPTPAGISTVPKISKEEALRTVTASLDRLEHDCPNCRSEIILFALENKPPRLAYRILAPISLAEGWAVTVDAVTGAILNRVPTVYNQTAN